MLGISHYTTFGKEITQNPFSIWNEWLKGRAYISVVARVGFWSTSHRPLINSDFRFDNNSYFCMNQMLMTTEFVLPSNLYSSTCYK